jgi:hypothetical protein
MELTLDFSGLDSIATRQAQKDFLEPVREEAVQSTIEATGSPQKPATGSQEAMLEELGKVATIKLQREQEEHKKTLEIYREYQQNIKRSGQLRTDILRGVKAGEAPQVLLLKAVECISLMTGDSLFYRQIQQDLKAVWGEGFLDRIPLEWELEEVRKHLENLLEALDRETTTDSRERIKGAIEAHRKKEKELEELIKRTPEATRAGA